MLKYNDQGQAFWNKERVPRTTEIVRLIAPRNWDVDEYFLRKGRLIHLICQWWLEKSLDESSVDPLLIPYLDALKHFMADLDIYPEGLGTEISFYSRKYGFCGRADLYLRIYNYLSVIDIKSGQPHEGDKYQTPAYLFGLKDAGFPCWRAFDLYLKKTGKYSLVEQKQPSILFNKFMQGVRQWQTEQKLK